MSTDQKKKLLWGNKKSTTAEEVFPSLLYLNDLLDPLCYLLFVSFSFLLFALHFLNILGNNFFQSGHRWDTALFGDRDRQEKFNKLMVNLIFLLLYAQTVTQCLYLCKGLLLMCLSALVTSGTE